MSAEHGSDDVMEGKLKGATDKTDYFYFLCPNCPDERILRTIKYEVVKDEAGNRYSNSRPPTPMRSFIIRFQIFCSECGLNDYVKISNLGWQGGKYGDALGGQSGEADLSQPG